MRTRSHCLVLGALLLGTSLLNAQGLPATAGQPLTLQQAIELAQRGSFQAGAALGARDAARGRDRGFDSRLLPQISLVGNMPVYDRYIQGVTQPDGSTRFVPVQQTRADVSMLVTQRVPMTGATVTMSSRLNQFQKSETDFSAGQKSWNSTPFSLAISQPLMRSNTIAWDRELNGLQADVAERQFLEAREDIAIQASNAFFDVYAAQVSLRNQTMNAATNDTLYRLNTGRYEVGKISENDLLQSELALLRARASQDGARLEYDRAQAALRLVLNAPADAPLEIMVTPNVVEVTIDTLIAVQQALRNTSTVRNLDLQDASARRAVSEANLNSGPGATLNASYGYNATGAFVNDVYRDLQPAQQLSLNLQVPLISWGARSGDRQAAAAELTRVQNTSRVAREQARQDAHFAALQVSLSRRQLAIAAKADTVAQKRFEVAYNRYVIGRIDVDQLYLAQNEKDQALLAYVQALKGYWGAYYRLRRVTLYDFERGSGIR